MTDSLQKLIRYFLALWAVGAFLSAAVHLFAPMFMSAGTSWPYACGWQREIALFDIALAGYIGLQLRSASHAELEKLMCCLAALSFCLGLNHFVSALFGGWAYVHVAGCIANALAVSVAFVIFMKKR